MNTKQYLMVNRHLALAMPRGLAKSWAFSRPNTFPYLFWIVAYCYVFQQFVMRFATLFTTYIMWYVWDTNDCRCRFSHGLILPNIFWPKWTNTIFTFWSAHFLETFCGCDIVTKFCVVLKKNYLKFTLWFSLNNS